MDIMSTFSLCYNLSMELYYDYVLKEDHTVCVYKIYGTNPIVELDDTINGYPISELGEYCFSSMRKLNKDTLKTYDTLPIGYVELTGKFIQSVKLSNSIKKIGNCTFYNCRNLREIIYPKIIRFPYDYPILFNDVINIFG